MATKPVPTPANVQSAEFGGIIDLTTAHTKTEPKFKSNAPATL